MIAFRRAPSFLSMTALLCSLVCAGSNLVRQAEEAWARRDQPGQTQRAIELWKRALQEDPAQHPLLIRLALAGGRAYRHAQTKADRLRWANEARRYAEEALKKNPNDAWAYAAAGEALGQWAEARQGVRSLKAVKQAVAALQKAIAIDPRHYYAHMLLSQFYTQSPRLFSVGNKEKGLEEAERAVRYGPQYAITHLSLARSLRALGHRQEAIEEYQKTLALAPPPDAVPETRANQEDAREELRSMGIPLATPTLGEPPATDRVSCEAQGKRWELTPSGDAAACHE